jgi:hypothetical protein
MQTQPRTHDTTPAYYRPDCAAEGRDQHDLRVLIDEIATSRGLVLQISLRVMSLHAAPDDASRAQVLQELGEFVSHFKRNMTLLYGSGSFEGQPQDRIDWIRKIAGRARERKAAVLWVRDEIDQLYHDVSAGKNPGFAAARAFFDSHWPVVRDAMTQTIWDLWADLDAQKLAAVAGLEQLHYTLETTLRDIKKISFSVRLTALNASVEAARSGDAGAGFTVIASEIKNLAEQIQAAADRAEDTVGDLRAGS